MASRRASSVILAEVLVLGVLAGGKPEHGQHEDRKRHRHRERRAERQAEQDIVERAPAQGRKNENTAQMASPTSASTIERLRWVCRASSCICVPHRFPTSALGQASRTRCKPASLGRAYSTKVISRKTRCSFRLRFWHVLSWLMRLADRRVGEALSHNHHLGLLGGQQWQWQQG